MQGTGGISGRLEEAYERDRMNERRTEISLYALAGSLALFLAVASAGGGLWLQEGAWISQWQHRLFRFLCHQDPARSFWIAGQPMAVCSRCFGIYGGLLAGMLAGPLLMPARKGRWDILKMSLMAIVLLNLGDVLGNILAFWQNTLTIRFGLGALLGLIAALVMAGALIQTINRKPNKRYGSVRTI